MQARQVSEAQTLLREMQKSGFSLIQAECSRQAPIELQIDEARVVARQLLAVEETAQGRDIDDVAHTILNVAYRTSQDGAYGSPKRFWHIESFHVPIPSGMEPAKAKALALEDCNGRIRKYQLRVLNVETVFKHRLFGGMRATGLIVWYRV